MKKMSYNAYLAEAKTKMETELTKERDADQQERDRWYEEQSGYLKRLYDAREDVRLPKPKKKRRKPPEECYDDMLHAGYSDEWKRTYSKRKCGVYK